MAALMAARKSGQGTDWRPFVPRAVARYAEKTGVEVSAEAVLALKAWWEECRDHSVRDCLAECRVNFPRKPGAVARLPANSESAGQTRSVSSVAEAPPASPEKSELRRG